ncbi:hypothetical protein B0H16DRAFT_1459919 [Mycena metata]|uniref:Uncharacterized protein n=1 Tax=Mycena metata TaxID=1033252 RepID=A0AAD7NB44_9AGAR|nr:hypothetical protein B0H16DRAFT_1459919 [Mycena metata]
MAEAMSSQVFPRSWRMARSRSSLICIGRKRWMGEEIVQRKDERVDIGYKIFQFFGRCVGIVESDDDYSDRVELSRGPFYCRRFNIRERVHKELNLCGNLVALHKEMTSLVSPRSVVVHWWCWSADKGEIDSFSGRNEQRSLRSLRRPISLREARGEYPKIEWEPKKRGGCETVEGDVRSMWLLGAERLDDKIGSELLKSDRLPTDLVPFCSSSGVHACLLEGSTGGRDGKIVAVGFILPSGWFTFDQWESFEQSQADAPFGPRLA